MTRRSVLSGILLALACLFIVVVVRHSSAAPFAAPAGPGYEPLPGFPRDDPKGAIVFSSPTVVDIDGDGHNDVLVIDGDACVYAWRFDGTPLPGFPLMTGASCTGVPRSTTHVAIGDIDGDERPEIVAGNEGSGVEPGQRGKVFVWRADGDLLPGWPKEMDWNTTYASSTPEVYSVALADMDGDGLPEVLAGTNNNASNGGIDDVDLAFNLYAWKAGGTLLPGYPTQSRTAGIFGEIAAADLSGDGRADAIAGRDHPFLHAADAHGQPLSGWPVRLFVNASGSDPRTDAYIELTHAAPAAGDLDGDGSVELIVAGKVRAPSTGDVIGNGVVVLGPDGARRPGWDPARQGGPPLATKDYPHQAPALGDLDGDGALDIVVSTFDGHIRAYAADGVLLWDYDYAAGKVLFASEPALGDIDGDRQIDVVFGTYSPDGLDDDAVRLHALHDDGAPVSGFPLDLPLEAEHLRKGIRAAPTLADLDGDCRTDILASSLGGVVYAWRTPARWNAETAPWPTGRHDVRRSASLPVQSGTVSVRQLQSDYFVYLPVVSRGYCGF